MCLPLGPPCAPLSAVSCAPEQGWQVLDKYYVFHAGIEEDSSSSSEEDEDKRFAHVDVQSLYKWRATSHQCQLYLTLQSNVAHVALGAGWEQQHPDSVEEGSAVQVSSDNPNVAMVIPAHTGLHYAEPEPPPEFVPRVDQATGMAWGWHRDGMRMAWGWHGDDW